VLTDNQDILTTPVLVGRQKKWAEQLSICM
jgi:hypothetical protein